VKHLGKKNILKVEPIIKNPIYRNKRGGLLAIKLGSFPQWTKDGKKIHTTLLQVLDNHVIDYVTPQEIVTKNERLKRLSLDGQYGMLLVGALSCDPRMVK
jgi:large subunit ribosomal protein L3